MEEDKRDAQIAFNKAVCEALVDVIGTLTELSKYNVIAAEKLIYLVKTEEQKEAGNELAALLNAQLATLTKSIGHLRPMMELAVSRTEAGEDDGEC
jgi:hypothetical protein